MELILQVMMDLKTHAFINQHLIHYNQKRTKVIMYLVGNEREYISLSLSHYILLSDIA